MPTTSIRVETVADRIVELLAADTRVPRDPAVYQLRRSVECGKARPVHTLLAILFERAEHIETPIGAVTESLELMVECLREARRMKLEAVTGQAHQIAGPSLLREIQREDRAENAENYAERELVSDEDDPEKLRALLDASARERLEQDRRDQRVREQLARVLMREAVMA